MTVTDTDSFVHSQKPKLLALLDYAILHPHSHQWIGPLTLLLQREGGGHER